MADATCIGCGCSDNDACMLPGRDGGRERFACGWVVVDRNTKLGICSAPECRSHMNRWDAGKRELSDKAKERVSARAHG